MKKSAIISILGILLFSGNIRSNPIAPTFMNELQVDSAGWLLELSPEMGTFNLDGWYLTTTTDTAYFKNNLSIPSDTFLIITQDSLLSVLVINPLGDSLVLHDSNGYDVERLVFGSSENRMITNPLPHQSLSRYTASAGPWNEDFYYLDNTPTLGLANDTVNAIGTIEGIVTDTAGLPIENVKIFYDYYYGTDSTFVYTDENGHFSFSHLANRKYFQLNKNGYEVQNFVEQIYPDSTISLSIALQEHFQFIDPASGNILKNFNLSENYPNPFNNVTTFYYYLPVNTQVEFLIYNVRGKLVDKLFYGYQKEGQYKINWDFKDLPSGVYIYQLNTPEMILNKKCVLLK